MYNGLASTWNEGMAGKEGYSFMYEADSDMESAIRHISRGNANAVEIEGIAAMAIFHKVGEFGELRGSGPVPGVLEVSDRVKSVAQFKNYFPKEGTMIEFVFDADSNTFLVGKPHGRQGAASPHQKLVLSLNKKGNYVGGMFKREGNTIVTDEYSGHSGHKWNDQIRKQFVNYMEQKTGLKVNHTKWR